MKGYTELDVEMIARIVLRDFRNDIKKGNPRNLTIDNLKISDAIHEHNTKTQTGAESV